MITSNFSEENRKL